MNHLEFGLHGERRVGPPWLLVLSKVKCFQGYSSYQHRVLVSALDGHTVPAILVGLSRETGFRLEGARNSGEM